jgi:hypothetical protein
MTIRVSSLFPTQLFLILSFFCLFSTEALKASQAATTLFLWTDHAENVWIDSSREKKHSQIEENIFQKFLLAKSRGSITTTFRRLWIFVKITYIMNENESYRSNLRNDFLPFKFTIIFLHNEVGKR